MSEQDGLMKFGQQYAELAARLGGDPIESGMVGNLADNECRHGALPSDAKQICQCWVPSRKRGKR